METKAQQTGNKSLIAQFPLKFHRKDRNYVLCEGGLIYIFRPEYRNEEQIVRAAKPASRPSSLAAFI